MHSWGLCEDLRVRERGGRDAELEAHRIEVFRGCGDDIEENGCDGQLRDCCAHRVHTRLANVAVPQRRGFRTWGLP